MNKPKMILFDYGNTLVYEPSFDGEAGFRAVLEHCTETPQGVDAAQLAAVYAPALEKLMSASRAAEADIMDMAVKRRIYEELELGFDLDLVALERVFCQCVFARAGVPGHPQRRGEQYEFPGRQSEGAH